MSAAPKQSYEPAFGGPLRESDYQKLRMQSGIEREWVDRAVIRRVASDEGRAIVGNGGSGDFAGVVFPYFLPGEDRPREWALRRDNPDLEYGSDGEAREKRKYLFPPGRGNLMYFPPGVAPEHLADKSVPLVIVEGAKKSIACQQVAEYNLPDSAEKPPYIAIGISGVWNWRGVVGKTNGPDGGRRDVKGPIPDLDRIQWRGRKVTIAFDTNVIGNESVQAARMELTKELRKRGAAVHWLHWPANTPQSVNGLDDLLAIEGPERVLALIREAKPYREATAGVKVWTLTELIATRFAKPVPIAEEFINEGETVALVGKPKWGKSRLMQQFAINVTRGHSFLGHHVGRARRVLMLDLENRPAGAKDRFMKMAGSEPNDNLLIYAPEMMANAITLANENGARQLEQLIADIVPDVIVIDNWRLFLGGDENKTEVVVRGLKALSKLRGIVPGLGIVLVHHVRKQQQGEHQPRLRVDPSAWVEAASGHYAFVAHVDGCFGLEREKDQQTGDELIVFGGVARNSQPRTLLLDEDETLMFRVSDGDDVAEKLLTQTEQAIWLAIRKLGSFTFSEVVQQSGTKNRKAVASMLRKAENMRLISKGLDRVYRRVEGTREGKRN